MAKRPSRIVIEAANTYLGNQSWYFREVFKQGDHKIRVEIRVNAYDFQSYARVEVWNPNELQWNVIHSIPYSKMDSIINGRISYVMPRVDMGAFWTDRTELVKKAEQILF